MSFFPLRRIPGMSWPNVPPGPVSQLWGMYLRLEQTQWLSPEEIVQGQLAQVRGLLAHCGQHVPYYRDLLKKVGVRPADVTTLEAFRRVPILRRRTYQEQFPLFQAHSLPPGVCKTKESDTSGTTGIPIKVWQTNRVGQWWLACCLRELHWCRIDPRGSMAVIRLLDPAKVNRDQTLAGTTAPLWGSSLGALFETGPLHLMDVHQDPRRQLQWLLQVQPDYLLCPPANAVFLAGLLQESRQRLANLKVIQVLAETLSEDAQQCIEAAFGVPVKNIYSCTEAGYLASACPEGQGLHVHAENVLLEVLNDQDQPCRPGERGRVIVTTLHNHLTPFLRYEILDFAVPGPERCPCGRGLPLLKQVEGKERPLLRLPDGRLKSSQYLVTRLCQLEVCHQFQIIQRAVDRIQLQLVPNGRWTEETPALVVRCVQECLETSIGVEVQLVDRVQLTPGGKLRAVIVEMKSR